MSQASQPRIEREFAFNAQDFEFLSNLAYMRTGIVLKDHKFDMVYARIARRCRALGLATIRDYCALMASDEGHAELGNLVNAITTNLTSFFREPHHFDHLRAHVFEPFHRQSSPRLRIWSAGCSAGAEAYSIAMTMQDTIPDIAKRDCKILATDIDTGMLEKAKRAEYSAEWIEKIPQALRQKYVSQNRINEATRALVTFKQLNLLEGWPFKGPFDAIFCRNVVIYFDKQTQIPLFDRFAQMLKPNGYLYIGHSESLHNVSTRFTLVDKTTYQQVS